jgi:hypothetical protein
MCTEDRIASRHVTALKACFRIDHPLITPHRLRYRSKGGLLARPLTFLTGAGQFESLGGMSGETYGYED